MEVQERGSTPREEEGVDLHELHSKVKSLLKLLQDRQPGLSTWDDALETSLEALHQLTSEALDKKKN